MKIKVEKDFLGFYIDFNGQINRPSLETSLDLNDAIKAKIVKYSNDIEFKDSSGRSELWSSCGYSRAYFEAKNFLSKEKFEEFAVLACGYEFAKIGQTRDLYPRLKSMFPDAKMQPSQLTEYLSWERELMEKSIQRQINMEIKDIGHEGVVLKAINPARKSFK